jgi:hypothetical protein
MHEASLRARKLGAAIEPFAGQVYFSAECHANYDRLGFGPSPGEFAGVQSPERRAYFCSRGSVMGQVPGEVVAAAFGVFSPAAVVQAVREGWRITDAAAICAARDDGAIAQLRRVLGDKPDGIDRVNALLARAVEGLRPDGKALFAGQLSLHLPGSPLGDAWRNADRLREYRGDAHIAAWVSAGFDGCEISLLTEPYWGLPTRTYARTRGWTDAEFDGAEARLASRGLFADGALTAAGQEAREAIEVATDRVCTPILDALGDDLDELLSLLSPYGAAIRAAHGYPARGPLDLSSRAAAST